MIERPPFSVISTPSFGNHTPSLHFSGLNLYNPENLHFLSGLHLYSPENRVPLLTFFDYLLTTMKKTVVEDVVREAVSSSQ